MPKPQGATPKKSPDGISLFAAALVGVILTLGIMLFLYLWNPFNQGKADLTTEDMPMVQPKNTSVATTQPTNYEFYDLLKQQQVSGVPDQAIASQTVPTNPKPDVVVTGQANTDKNAKSSQADTENSQLVANGEDGESVDTSRLGEDNQATATADNQTVNTNKPADKRININDADTGRTFILQINSFDNADAADSRRAEVLLAGVDAQIVKKHLSDDSLVYQVISRPMNSPQMAAQAQQRLQSSGIDSLIVEQRRQ